MTTPLVCNHPNRLVLKEFNGDKNEAVVWFSKFELLAGRYQWTSEDKITYLGFNLTENAGVWFSTLPTTVKDSWDALKDAFKAQFIESESRLILQSRLQNCKMGPGDSIEDYYSNILSLGSKLGRAEEDIASAFLNGLPMGMQDFILTTDNHSMSNYLNRARLYVARNPSKSVSFEQSATFNVTDRPTDRPTDGPTDQQTGTITAEMQTSMVNALTESLTKLGVGTDQEKGSKSRRDRYRSPSLDSEGRRDYSRGRSKSPRGRRSRDRSFSPRPRRDISYERRREQSRSNWQRPRRYPSRGRRHDDSNNRQRGRCWTCGSPFHYQRFCPHNYNARPPQSNSNTPHSPQATSNLNPNAPPFDGRDKGYQDYQHNYHRQDAQHFSQSDRHPNF